MPRLRSYQKKTGQDKSKMKCQKLENILMCSAVLKCAKILIMNWIFALIVATLLQVFLVVRV